MLRWFHRQTGDTRGTLPCPAFPSGRVRPGLGTADQPLYASSPAEASGCHWKDAPWGGEEVATTTRWWLVTCWACRAVVTSWKSDSPARVPQAPAGPSPVAVVV